MILIINLCKEKLHEYEFILPVQKILDRDFVNEQELGKNYFVKKYGDVTYKDLKFADKVIICGTSLDDNGYFENEFDFEWLDEFQKPVLGICAGAQMIHKIFGGKVQKIKEIGQVKIEFSEKFLGVDGEIKVYSLHQNYVLSSEFDVYGMSKNCAHACKHNEKEIYTCLFHPEVYNPEIIDNFLKL